MDISKYIAEYQKGNTNVRRFNKDIIYGIRKESIVDYIIDSFKTLEVIKNIEIIDWEHIEDETKFDYDVINHNHIKRHQKKNVPKHVRKVINIQPSLYSMLKIKIRLTAKGEVRVKTVKLLIMKFVDDYCFLINGNKFYPIYQLVDASTYNNKDYITLKTMLMPISVKRILKEIKDIDDIAYTVPNYTIVLFKKRLNFLMYYLATIGLKNTIKYMGMHGIIKVEEVYNVSDDVISFKAKDGVYINVEKHFFEKDHFTQSVVYGLKEILGECKLTFDEMGEINKWCAHLGSLFTTSDNHLEKGKTILISFYRLLDNITRRMLRLTPYNKANIFAVIRWMTQNFSELKAKDNMDLKNKRIRLSEYIAFYFSKRLATKTNALLMKKDITMDDLLKLVSFPQNEIIRQIYKNKSPLLRYDNTTNDMNMFTALKYTVKGPGSLGEKNSNSVDKKYRTIHESHIGRLDINTSSTSDPGLTGMISPFAKTYGHFFDDGEEPQTWNIEFKKLYEDYYEKPYKSVDLEYVYKLEEKLTKKIRRMENVYDFIKNDPFFDDYHMRKLILKRISEESDKEEKKKEKKMRKLILKRI